MSKVMAESLPADGTLLTARGVRSRAGLLAAARVMFKSKGYASTTIKDITNEAGCAPGSFYTYFTNKEEVLVQLAKDFKSEIVEHMSELDLVKSDPYDLIRELCSVYWCNCRDHAAELAAMFQAAMLDERFKRHWREIRSDARSQIAAAIANAEKAGLVKVPNPNPDAMASAIGAMMNYFSYIWLIEGGEFDGSIMTDDIAIETMTRIFYRAVFAAPEPPIR